MKIVCDVCILREGLTTRQKEVKAKKLDKRVSCLQSAGVKDETGPSIKIEQHMCKSAGI